MMFLHWLPVIFSLISASAELSCVTTHEWMNLIPPNLCLAANVQVPAIFIVIFSAQVYCVSSLGPFFSFYCPERVPPRWVISWGETRSLVNDGGLVILPHVCNDLRSVQGGRAGGTPGRGQQPGSRQNRIIWTNRTVQHFVSKSKQRDSRSRRLLGMSHKKDQLLLSLFLVWNQWLNAFLHWKMYCFLWQKQNKTCGYSAFLTGFRTTIDSMLQFLFISLSEWIITLTIKW